MATVAQDRASSSPYTGSSAFFEALWDAGVTHCFCNLGSDHPSILEAIVNGKQTRPDRFPTIITCPSEMVAMSMADGFARVTGKPQAVIVHVDVGTQALGCAVHNASVGRTPLLIFAGLSPFTIEGELKGSRTEYIQWLQDVHNQKDIVGQYCRYSTEIRTGTNIKQIVNRALSFASSDPKGPVYLCAAREVLEADLAPYQINQNFWSPVDQVALSSTAVQTIADALVNAREPLVVTGYSGRDVRAPAELVNLANTVKGLRVFDAGGSDMCFPADHPGWLGCGYGGHESIRSADVILVLDCDVPWIPTRCKPHDEALVLHVDIDPLKQSMPVFYINAQHRYRADSYTALKQINEYVASNTSYRSTIESNNYALRWERLLGSHAQHLKKITEAAMPTETGHLSAHYLLNQLRKALPDNTIFVVEAITNTGVVSEQIQATLPGSWLNCGGGGLGWSGGAALGVKLATDYVGEKRFVCQIVGDGSYLFSFPGSVYWIARRYNIPILTIVLNNNGWNAPRNSLLLVRPDGPASKVDRSELNISFSPAPDYAGIAKAAGHGDIGVFRTAREDDLPHKLAEAVKFVQGEVK
ncbi:thiamine pyrophosphate enzyme, N-terminal TPP binding domain-containing protein [Dactylonectria estremocensis]|uniref:Thiamine pyrophosphate enzyme, N-terminal TPP binding domain-containing protein n=1 Tax=Dactylonectria estremocensis TaxID=1079267 RepID=A0A9P9IG24_9HYPO|nr:thiamine pyrophosphate enzyme, N-terminal TPP binding domain-containing protein [Dactylonectria estremocensis]